MAFEIKHPTANNRTDGKCDKRVPGMFVAVVRVVDEADIVGVVGTLDAQLGDGRAISGTAAWTQRDRQGGRSWVILFGTPSRPISEGAHSLDLRKFRANGESESAGSIEFESNGLWGPGFIEIGYPANNADIHDERDYFVAYGPLSHDAVSVSLTDTGDNSVVLADSLYSSLEHVFWSAVFPPLAQGKTYRLEALDSSTHTADPRTVTT